MNQIDNFFQNYFNSNDFVQQLFQKLKKLENNSMLKSSQHFNTKFEDKSSHLEDKSQHIKDLSQQFDLSEIDIQNLSLLIEYRLAQNQKFINILSQIACQSPKKNKNVTNVGNNRCLARIHSNNQCSRKCKTNDVEFCGSHLHSLPYGRIDMDPLNVNKLVEKKTRGRKSKNKSYVELDQIDLTNYIKTEIITIDGNEFLIDENNVIFENNNINTIVGTKIDEQYKWF